MGLFNKIKDILFEEVEEEEPKEAKKEKKPIAEKIEPQKIEEEPIKRGTSTPKVESTSVKKEEPISERNLFKSDNTFPFPEFDEEEFSSMSRVQKQKNPTNVLEYEKKKKTEKKYDFGRYERIEKTEVVERKKFKPSPIISPVYGILNEDYKIEDIKDKTDVNQVNNLDFNSVRKKAFGEIEKLEETPKETYYEETVTVRLKEDEAEKKQKVKTIDELLEDTSDVTIGVEEKKSKKESKIISYTDVDEDLEEIKENNKTMQEKVEDDDTLESDLFDLIDSMYDSREEDE